MKKACVVCADGIGDALLMMIASEYLFKKGFQVTTYSKPLIGMQPFFEHHHIRAKTPRLLSELLQSDLVILQNDNSEKTKEIIQAFHQDRSKLTVFLPTFEKHKHSFIAGHDQIFDAKYPMATNIAKSIASVFQSPHVSKNNGILPFEHLNYRKHTNRIVIHPTSKEVHKNWNKHKFLETAILLQDKGYEVSFCLSKEEHSDWPEIKTYGFKLPTFKKLSELGEYIYESGYFIGNDSGPAHLASNLHIPNIVISNSKKRMKLWRPDWIKGYVLTPSSFIPNLKGLRLREDKWQSFIYPRHVLRAFGKLSRKNSFGKKSSF